VSLGWSAEEYLDVCPWLAAHIEICPLAEHETSSTCPEVDVIAKDTDADLLVIARPDLLYARDQKINWRETKTVTAPVVHDPNDFLEAYPQLPLAICMLADRATEGELSVALGANEPGDVELELLWPGGSQVLKWNAGDLATVSKARHLVAGMVDKWAFDKEWLPSTNPPCRWCSMASICEFANASPGAVAELPPFDPQTGEILAGAEKPVGESTKLSATAIALGLATSLYLEDASEEEVAF